MSFRLVAEETTRAPKYHTRTWLDGKGNVKDVLTKEPTGGYIETVFRFWRCSCGARAVTAGIFTGPGDCARCRR